MPTAFIAQLCRLIATVPGQRIRLKGWGPFVLRQINAQTTRFMIRSRGNYDPDFGNVCLNLLLWRLIFEPAHFVTKRKMLLSIMQRAEATAKQQAEAWLLEREAGMHAVP